MYAKPRKQYDPCSAAESARMKESREESAEVKESEVESAEDKELKLRIAKERRMGYWKDTVQTVISLFQGKKSFYGLDIVSCVVEEMPDRVLLHVEYNRPKEAMKKVTIELCRDIELINLMEFGKSETIGEAYNLGNEKGDNSEYYLNKIRDILQDFAKPRENDRYLYYP